MKAASLRFANCGFKHPQPGNSKDRTGKKQDCSWDVHSRECKSDSQEIGENGGNEKREANRFEAEKHAHPTSAKSPNERHEKSPREQGQVALIENMRPCRASPLQDNIKASD